jgi:hypothetical protein
MGALQVGIIDLDVTNARQADLCATPWGTGLTVSGLQSDRIRAQGCYP